MHVANSYGAVMMFGLFGNDAVQNVAKRLGLQESLTIMKGHRPAPEDKAE
jgi:hypothetical protein